MQRQEISVKNIEMTKQRGILEKHNMVFEILKEYKNQTKHWCVYQENGDDRKESVP